MVYCKVINAMENRESRGVREAGQFVAFNRVLRRVHMCRCTAVRGGSRGADKEAVISKQEHSKGAWLGLWHLFMTGKHGQIRSSLHSPNMSETHIYPLLQPFTAFIFIMPEISESQFGRD